ncbi:MAG: calcium-binding protein [Phyllobacteriaceae bacterium]|nr:calcium-binding protein [Phyllobacteriaceae bacterium]
MPPSTRLDGGAGNDVLLGRGGADVLLGGTGSDTADFTGSAAVNVNLQTGIATGGDAQGDTLLSIENLRGGDGGDVLTGDDGNNILRGGDGADTLIGGNGINRLLGEAGNDRMIGGAGTDEFDGGTGTDTVDFSASLAAVAVDLVTSVGNLGDAEGDRFAAVENLVGTAFGDTLAGDANANELAGNAGQDRLYGGEGNDALLGGDGDDLLAGGSGADLVAGGAGQDTADYSASSLGVSISIIGGTAGGGDATGDILQDIESLTGSSSADTLTGDDGINLISGGTGDDTIDGLADMIRCRVATAATSSVAAAVLT